MPQIDPDVFAGGAPRAPRQNRAAVFGPIVLLLVGLGALAITWVHRSMRAVMDVGGTCAEGGPYVPMQPCPDGAILIAPAIPVAVIAALVGTALAVSIKAPNLLLPMWAGVFGALGWNFLDFAFQDGHTETGWLICGILFWLMAAPAVVGIFAERLVRRTIASARQGRVEASSTSMWLVAYAVMAMLGIWCGVWTWDRLA